MSGGTTSYPPPEDQHRWRRLVAVFAITQTLGYGAFIQAFTVLLVPMADDLHASRSAVTFAATISTLVGAAAALPVGTLLDRRGGRALMGIGSTVGAAAVVLWSRAESLTALYLAFALVGVAMAMSAYETALAVLVVATEPRERDGAIILVTMVTGLATSLYYPLTGWLDALIGWRSTLLVLAGTLAVVAIPAHLWAVPGRAAHSVRAVRRGGAPVGDALRNPRFWLMVVAFVAQAGATTAFLVLMVPYFRDVGHSPATAAAIPAVVGFVQIGSRLALTPLSRRFGMATVTASAFGVQGLGLLALLLVGTSVPLTLLCVSAVGLGYSVSIVARSSIVADTFGVARFASIVAVMTVPTALSKAGAPLVGALLPGGRFLLMTGVAALVAGAALVPLARSRTLPTGIDDEDDAALRPAAAPGRAATIPQ